jgi:hypothetical protein
MNPYEYTTEQVEFIASSAMKDYDKNDASFPRLRRALVTAGVHPVSGTQLDRMERLLLDLAIQVAVLKER